MVMKIRLIRISLIILVLLGLTIPFEKPETAGLSDSPWPMLQHDPQHTGRSPYKGPETPELKWKYQIAGFNSLYNLSSGYWLGRHNLYWSS